MNHERIEKAVAAATINGDDKAVIAEFFRQVNDGQLNEIAELFEKKPEWIVIFNENRKKKIEAYKAGDSALWQQILDEEKKYLEDLTYGLD